MPRKAPNKDKTGPEKDPAQAPKQTPKTAKVKAILHDGFVTTENSDEARLFFNQSRFGTLEENGRVTLSYLEALYLMSKDKLDVFDGRNHLLTSDEFWRKARRAEPNITVKYFVFTDLRDRGYIVKTALKFGADFRVYDRGVKPGEDHAKWIVYPVHEGSVLTWHEFAAKNRVAHSTKKRLLMGIVDDEKDVTYYEIKWMRP